MKKTLVVLVSAVFLILQNTAPLFAANAANWAELYNNSVSAVSSTLTNSVVRTSGDPVVAFPSGYSLYINGGYGISTAVGGTMFSIASGGSLDLATGSYVSGGIVNNGVLSFSNISSVSGGISGSGSLHNYAALSTNDNISQSTLTNSGNINNYGTITASSIQNGGVLSSRANTLYGLIINGGTLNLTGGSNTNTIRNSAGDTASGTVNFSGNSDNNAIVTQYGVTNSGFLNNNAVVTVNTLTNNASAILNNNALITAGGVIGNAGTINTNADLLLASSVVNSGVVNFESGTNRNTIVNAAGNTSVGTVNFTGSTTNNGTITQNTVSNSGTLTNNAVITAAKVENSDVIINNSSIVGALRNTGTISGSGSLAMTGNSTNNGSISQSALSNSGNFTNNSLVELTGVLTNSGTVTTKANLVTASSINNSGQVFFTEGINANVISGAGTTNFGGVSVNNASVAQGTVNNTGTLTSNSAISAATALNNAGTLTSNAAITAGAVTNSGTLNNNALLFASSIANTGVLSNNALLQSATGTNSGTITSSTANYDIAALANNGTLTLTGAGTLGSSGDSITGTGTTTLNGGVGGITNNTAISQTTVNNNGVFNNNASVSATTFNNTSLVYTNASNLSGTVNNSGTVTYTGGTQAGASITGTGNLSINGNTILAGNNTYTGVTTLSSNLSIGDQRNIGTGDILFYGGVLQTTSAAALDNDLTSIAGNNVQIQSLAALSLGGTITGADFIKSGAGDLTLAMASNAYNNTFVQAGKLIGTTANINGSVNVSSGATAEFTDIVTNTLNTVTGNGTVLKSGNSLTNVTNNLTANTVNVTAGKLAVNTANYNVGTTNIGNAAAIGGNGTITGNVNILSGATLAPGNSVDTITVAGNLNLASGSNTTIEVTNTPTVAADKTIVTGNATINTGANLAVDNIGNDRFFEWKSFNILEAAGTLSGAYTYDGSISNYDSSRIGGSLSYDYTNGTVTLLAKRKATNYTNTVANLSHNQAQAAQIVDKMTATSLTGDITNPLLQLEALAGLNPQGITAATGATINSALADMDGVLYANSALTSLFNAKSAHIYDRISSRRAAPATGCPTCHDNVWTQYYNQYNKVYADSNSPRYTNNVSGVMAGYDRYSEDNSFLLGAFAGSSKADLRQYKDTMDINDVTVGAYGGYLGEDWTFKGVLYMGYQDYDGSRRIAFMNRTAHAQYDGHNIALDLEAAYNIPVLAGVNVKPFAGLLNSYSHQQHFNETGADSLNLNVESNNAYNIQARLGAQAEGKVSKFNWYANMTVKQFLGNDYDRINVSLSLPDTKMDIISAKLGKTYFSSGVGLSYSLTDNLNIFGNGEAGVGRKAANCYGNIGFAYNW